MAYAFDAVRRGLEQLLGVSDPHASHPLHRSLPRFRLKAAIQGAHADRGLRRDVAQCQVAVRLAFDPGQHAVQFGAGGNPLGGGSISQNELRLTSAAVQRRHRQHLGVDVLEATGVNIVHARVVDDGDLVTSGSVTSGLDLALHLLDRSYGPRVAIAVESLFGYERRGTVWR